LIEEENSYIFKRLHPTQCAPVAQLDRAFGYEPKGRRFESFRAHHSIPKLRLVTIATTDFFVAAFFVAGLPFLIESPYTDELFADEHDDQSQDNTECVYPDIGPLECVGVDNVLGVLQEKSEGHHESSQGESSPH
jgi:hypothetical protein